MEQNFLSVDWDYFIQVHNEKSNSYRETQQDILAKWYNEWIIGMEGGEPLEGHYELTHFLDTFKTEYKCILHSYGLLEDNKASKPTVTKKKTTKTSKSSTKTTSKSTTKAASKKKVTK